MLDRLNMVNAWTIRIALGVTLVMWASAFVGIRVALTAYSPTHLALLRFGVASVTLAVFAAIARIRRPRRQDLVTLVLSGFIGITLYNLAINLGERSVTAASASLLVNTVPIWTALLATGYLGEHLGRRGWLGMALSFIGAVGVSLGEGAALRLNWGAGLLLVAAIAQASYFVLQKRVLSRYRPFEFTLYAIWSGTLFLLPFASGLGTTIQAAPWPATLAVIYLGLGPAALAYVTWAYVLTYVPAARAARFLYAVPLITMGIGWIWLAEMPSLLAIGSGILTLLGVAIVRASGTADREVPAAAEANSTSNTINQ